MLSVCIVACKDLSLNMRVIRQARSLAEAGHAVTVVGFKLPETGLTDRDEAITLLATGKPPSPLTVLGELWLLTRLRQSEDVLRARAEAGVAAMRSPTGRFGSRLMTSLAGHSFDVVQAHFDKALTASSMLARKCRAKLVFDAVEVPFDEEQLPRSPIVRTMRRAEIRRESAIAVGADGWITVNHSLADAAANRFRIERPFVLHNFQSEEGRGSDGRLRQDLNLLHGERILLHLNTMRSGEGLETGIDALAHLPSEFHLVGLGPTPERGFVDAMKRRAEERGVSSRFHIAPFQPLHAVSAYIADADLGVFARRSDRQNFRLSLPNRVFQMIAAGLPIVATPLPEVERLIERRGIGISFEEANPVAFAAAVRAAMEPSRRTALIENVKRAAREMTWRQEGPQYVAFIENIAAGNPGRSAASADAPLRRPDREAQRVGGKQ